MELAGIAPTPFAGMVLADLGAEVLRIDRPGDRGLLDLMGDARHDLLGRGKRSVLVDLKRPDGAGVVLRLAASADALIEGYRPGVAERLGIGPAECHAVNPRLVYGRLTGWGQDGPLAGTAGHDVGYLALSGVLHTIGTAEAPVIPPNVLGDCGGGGMLLAVGVLAALLQAKRSGLGQVVDASIVEGVALLATQVYGLLHAGLWRDARAANLFDGAAPHYGVYRTADDRHLAVAPLEPKFWSEFAALLGGGMEALNPYEPENWPALRARIAERIASRTRAEWLAVFDGTDACVSPVLSLTEAAGGAHPQLAARETFVAPGGVPQPAPAPRFSVTPAVLSTLPPYPGEHTRQALLDWGVSDVEALLAAGVVSLGESAGTG